MSLKPRIPEIIPPADLIMYSYNLIIKEFYGLNASCIFNKGKLLE